MTFLLAYLYVYYLIFLPMVMHMHIKFINTFENWLIAHPASLSLSRRKLGSAFSS